MRGSHWLQPNLGTGLSTCMNLHRSPCLRWAAHHPPDTLWSGTQRSKAWTEKPGSAPGIPQEGSASQPSPQPEGFCPTMISPMCTLQCEKSIWNEYHRSFYSLKITSDISLLAKPIRRRQGRGGIQSGGRELPQSSTGGLLLSLACVLWL